MLIEERERPGSSLLSFLVIGTCYLLIFYKAPFPSPSHLRKRII